MQKFWIGHFYLVGEDELSTPNSLDAVIMLPGIYKTKEAAVEALETFILDFAADFTCSHAENPDEKVLLELSDLTKTDKADFVNYVGSFKCNGTMYVGGSVQEFELQE